MGGRLRPPRAGTDPELEAPATFWERERGAHVGGSVGGRLRPPSAGTDPELEAPATFWGCGGGGFRLLPVL